MSKFLDWPRPVSSGIGLTREDIQNFSIVRGIRALGFRGSPDGDQYAKDASRELEISVALAQTRGKPARGLCVPGEVLHRDLTVGSDPGGGYTVATNLLSGSFIDMLRNRLAVRRAGATILSGLVGDAAIPKQSGSATAYWVAEGGAPTKSDQTFGQLALAPKTVGAYTELTRKLVLQSSRDIENFVRADLARVLATAIDLACLHGTGTNNQPSGIAITEGIGSVAGGTNGGAPTWDDLVNLETEVAVDNADIGSVAYITNARVRSKLKRTTLNATYGEKPLWERGPEPSIGEVNGYPAHVSNQVSSALTKGSASGTCSAIFFGNWADLVIGFWSGIDILVDPYSLSTTGGLRVTAFQDLDIGIRNVESFAVMLDALTT